MSVGCQHSEWGVWLVTGSIICHVIDDSGVGHVPIYGLMFNVLLHGITVQQRYDGVEPGKIKTRFVEEYPGENQWNLRRSSIKHKRIGLGQK